MTSLISKSEWHFKQHIHNLKHRVTEACRSTAMRYAHSIKSLLTSATTTSLRALEVITYTRCRHLRAGLNSVERSKAEVTNWLNWAALSHKGKVRRSILQTASQLLQGITKEGMRKELLKMTTKGRLRIFEQNYQIETEWSLNVVATRSYYW